MIEMICILEEYGCSHVMAKLLDKCFSPCMMIHISCTAPVLGVCEYGLISVSTPDIVRRRRHNFRVSF
ncbi:unnamed protein product [Callosobruchus maculatus]|uniref:Uncharacterized protein n=1 Tax=Callosobruchus maculatus TaxID=64391 RepID=A0A653DRS9_CALMS|nr:unnamed protein product [Callosobruchus maculatus]